VNFFELVFPFKRLRTRLPGPLHGVIHWKRLRACAREGVDHLFSRYDCGARFLQCLYRSTRTDCVKVRIIFHGRFLRSHGFSMQNSATGCKRNALGLAFLSSWSNVLQKRANPRKNSLLNYETAALPAELRRRDVAKIASDSYTSKRRSEVDKCDYSFRRSPRRAR
jgi:hypothetical protein